MKYLPSWQCVLASLLAAASLFSLPANEFFAGNEEGGVIYVTIAGLVALIIIIACLYDATRGGARIVAPIQFVLAHTATFLLFLIAPANGLAGPDTYMLLAACWLLAWRCVTLLSTIRPVSRTWDTALRLIIPAIFGAWILIIWEAVTRGAGIPFILLPPPSAIGARIASSLPILGADVRQTIFKAVIFGYVVGSGAGFVTAILADRVPFLRRGLLPIGNMVSALPIIGVAPIMVMWFGFDWQSKAAVVIIMTFFPMLVNTVAGLAASGHMERDLMRTYASGYWPTLIKLRLPAAAPFIFNALKINSTLALIGAIVAEFFGTPVVGMGFRISTEVGRMNIDMVWAEIAVAALAGSVFYGVVALVERAVTFWHPSVRGG
ncbi:MULTISPECIES: ABC transporter permease [unclassified Mesorhizobium]|uniref:ABC transporter permease n=1 Tax=unclassified Mesorhizobium TaxID=325217 RepID=UPI00112DC93D|nr:MULTISPECIES: ABC transporter permease [unclassified Mesorhizobium]MBZ9982881.1 ABC transporter permease [Mesorhizobium sp. BR-1-1-8]TPL36396.1 ABC transporter permease [Mesorhizobium sp. B2-4-8]TPL66420.1 ABC transporter permease [Mesorhizobium sp. B2-4-1]